MQCSIDVKGSHGDAVAGYLSENFTIYDGETDGRISGSREEERGKA